MSRYGAGYGRFVCILIGSRLVRMVAACAWGAWFGGVVARVVLARVLGVGASVFANPCFSVVSVARSVGRGDGVGRGELL